MFTTYIIYSQAINKFYTGQTSDLSRRLEEHNRGKTPFLKNGIPWELVFNKELGTRTEAISLENYIKKRGAKRFLVDLKRQNG